MGLLRTGAGGVVAVVIGSLVIGGLTDLDCWNTTREVEMKVDEDQSYTFTLDSKVERFEYNLERKDRENHKVDVYFFDEINYDQYKNGHSFVYVKNLSNPTNNDKTFERGPYDLVRGQYYLTMDNTYLGNSAPPTDGENNEFYFNVVMKTYRCW